MRVRVAALTFIQPCFAAVFVLQIFSLFFIIVPKHCVDRLKHVLTHPIKAHVNGPLQMFRKYVMSYAAL